MWWFLKKSRPAAPPVRLPVRASEREQAKQGLLDAIPDMSRLDDHNVAIKICSCVGAAYSGTANAG